MELLINKRSHALKENTTFLQKFPHTLRPFNLRKNRSREIISLYEHTTHKIHKELELNVSHHSPFLFISNNN